MNKNKIKFYSILLWGVVLYSIALLIYSTNKIVFHDSADAISAFGSILGAFGTLFATIVAAYLFNDWKDQKKYEIVSTLALEAHREFIYAKDKYHFFLFQHIYGTPEITYKEVDDDLFKVISKLNLLDAILERFKFGIRINSEIENIYTKGYCKVPQHYRQVVDLKRYGASQLQVVFDQAFSKDNDLYKKLLDIIEKVEDKK
ncbi:hypothetical protein [Acinetobacter dispersus]|uniref:Uncharacterized protein n=1 Tax=Acinetobacter dispersus TaxID=70348 RepID=N9LM22_9GAMM|nr:hypothetical protein [Acinetobacter dispersus]ENW97317.1 hypothetical protein F904_00155 [Acinetobacter dispersus]